ncbi:MAG: DUF3011 domain-containing protein [Sandaracinobacteroides sp.]
MPKKIATVCTALCLAVPLAAQVATPLPAPIRPQTPVARPQPLPAEPNWNNSSNNSSSNRNFAGTTRCESQNQRPRTCRARTQGRVEIVQVHGGSCRRGASFTYTGNDIRVTNGCRATFAYGYGNVRPQADSGSNALPWLLAGAGATAGIVALANSGNNQPAPSQPVPAQPAPPAAPAPIAPPAPQPPESNFPALPPARIVANTQMLTPDQQRTMQTCLFEGARQVGLAGGSVITLSSIDRIEQGSGGWRFNARGTATFPNADRNFAVFCRATPGQIVEFTVTPA